MVRPFKWCFIYGRTIKWAFDRLHQVRGRLARVRARELHGGAAEDVRVRAAPPRDLRNELRNERRTIKWCFI